MDGTSRVTNGCSPPLFRNRHKRSAALGSVPHKRSQTIVWHRSQCWQLLSQHVTSKHTGRGIQAQSQKERQGSPRGTSMGGGGMEGGSHAPPCSKLLDRAASEGSMKSPACIWSAVRTRPSTVKTNTCKEHNCSVCKWERRQTREGGGGGGGAGGETQFNISTVVCHIMKVVVITHRKPRI